VPPPPTATPAPAFPVVRGFGDVYSANPSVRARLGQPTGSEFLVSGAYEDFQYGIAFWRRDTRRIYTLASQGSLTWAAYPETWSEGEPPGGDPAPVPGLVYPTRGFGKVWRDNPSVQQRLGYALAAEVGQDYAMQPFEHGLMIWANTTDGDLVYVLYNDGTLAVYPNTFHD
jgi:hypothetical protein